MTLLRRFVLYWLGPDARPGHLAARWIFLRCLGLIFFSAFYSYLFQIQALIGPDGILPARDYLHFIGQHLGWTRYWAAPTLLWFHSGHAAIQWIVWTGLIASLGLVLNLWPRGMVALCTVSFLSFISTSQDFASYQSDGMLLEAGFISLFFVPGGWRPGAGENDPPSRASRFLLQWEWFRIYFESGLVKLLSGDPHWRHFTAMDDYYQNGPLPTWIGWYAQEWFPHGFHAACTALTLIVELGICCLLFAPRRGRIFCFWALLPFQALIILTANYAFINYIMVALSVLLLDDDYLKWRMPSPFREKVPEGRMRDGTFAEVANAGEIGTLGVTASSESYIPHPASGHLLPEGRRLGFIFSGIFLTWIFYATSALFLLLLFPSLPLPTSAIVALQPFRFANRYGLFAVMTPARYEIEFQGSNDGKNWVAYPFRYKPQDPAQAPGIYAPYQPRFEWNLWFASLGGWRDYPWVARTEELLLQNNRTVLKLFRSNPFPLSPPRYVRTVLWQYWFTDKETKRRAGLWWRRQLLGLYAPALTVSSGGTIVASDLHTLSDGVSGAGSR